MNLLMDPLFQVETPPGVERQSLPELLESLGQDYVDSLPRLQRHQIDPFHVFLCYLAGALLVRQGHDNPKQSTGFWRNGIRQLTNRQDDTAWTLVVDDVTCPAFMQAPVESAQAFKAFKSKALTADQLDLLPTAKNHDIKMSRMGDSSLEDWVFALISLQTMSGFFGQGNYGIARMNGGFGSRPFITLLNSDRLGPRFVRDVKKLLHYRQTLLQNPWVYQSDGIVLTWTAPWDRQSSLAPKHLDPFFIEIARAVRLRKIDDQIAAWTASTKAARICVAEAKGNLGDPWIPISEKTGAALTVSEGGLAPALLRDLLFEDGYQPAFMQRPSTDDQGKDCRFYVSVLIRGQGTTAGFRNESILVPGKVVRSLLKRDDLFERLARLSKQLLNDVSTLQNKVLASALFSLLEGGPESVKVNYDKHEISAWVNKWRSVFGDAWCRHYFEWLWYALDELDDTTVQRHWLHRLRDHALAVLEQAMVSAPERSGRRLRAISRAEGVFHSALKKQFGELMKGKLNATDG